MNRSLSLLCLLSVLLLGACSPTSETELTQSQTISIPEINPAESGNAGQAWFTLLENECNPMATDSHVWSPIENRVLMNVPRAILGYDFNDADDLKTFFEEDGSAYYKASTDSVTLPADWEACVKTLENHGTSLKDNFKGLDNKLIARFTNPQVFESLWFWGSTASETPYNGEHFLQISEDYIHYQMGIACEADVECGGYFIDCFGEEACVAGAAG